MFFYKTFDLIILLITKIRQKFSAILVNLIEIKAFIARRSFQGSIILHSSFFIVTSFHPLNATV